MKNPISSLRSWLGTSTVPTGGAEHQKTAGKSPASSRKREVAPQLGRLGMLQRQNARRIAPAEMPESSYQPVLRPSPEDDEELREAIAAIRSAAVWTPPSSAVSSPRLSLSGGSRTSSVRSEAPVSDEVHGNRSEVRPAETSLSGRSRTSSARSDAPRSGEIQGNRSEIHPADEPAATQRNENDDREILLDMVWDTDFPSRRMNDILARAPELVNTQDHRGETLLMNALTGGNVEFAKALIAHGADPNVRDELGNTPLHLAAGRGTEIVSQLLAAGADASAVNRRGATALFDARSPEMVDMLVQAGAPIDARDQQGNTAVMRLAQSGTRTTVLAVLGHNPDLTAVNNDNRTFAQLLTKRFGGVSHVIPRTAREAKAFLELIGRETPFMGDLRDRKPTLAGAARRNPPPPPAEAQRVASELRLAGAASAKPPAINSLKSGPKLSFVNDPERAFDDLNPNDVEALSEALGFGKLSSDPATFKAQKIAIRETFGRFANDIKRWLADYDNKALDHEALTAPLSPEERAELRTVMGIAHLRIAAEKEPGGKLKEPVRLRIFFEGTQNGRDFRQDIGSAFGRIGDVDRAARRAGELFAKILSHPDRVELDFISGQSMGGAMAQTFRAAIESRVMLPKQPSMILMDPQLLNNNQARRATKGGMLEVDYAQPRGVALTLDYQRDRRRGLMGIMKGPGGYRYPGLVHLRLGLSDTDGVNGRRPETSGPPGMGYHIDPRQFASALERFSVDREDKVLNDPAFDDVRAPNWARTAGPVRTSSTLPEVARHGRRPMEPIGEEDESASA